MRLADLLNSGKVSVGAPFRDEYGRAVRKVQVDNKDVVGTMVEAGVAREPGGEPQGMVRLSTPVDFTRRRERREEARIGENFVSPAQARKAQNDAERFLFVDETGPLPSAGNEERRKSGGRWHGMTRVDD